MQGRKEILEAVDSINYNLTDQQRDDNLIYLLEYSDNTWSRAVSICDQVVWCSENEDREWLEEANDYEPMEPYLRTKITQMIKELNTLKL